MIRAKLHTSINFPGLKMGKQIEFEKMVRADFHQSMKGSIGQTQLDGQGQE